MADSVTAVWHGHNYQARVFWLCAFDLLLPNTCVSEVAFEAKNPKGFDDVVVHFDPPVVRSGADRILAEYHQVKWHVQTGGRFGYKDLTEPKFIGAKSRSLLHKLQLAKESAVSPCRMLLVTPHRIADGDPLGGLVSTIDGSLLVEKLFDGTTDRSTLGKVRKCWRRCLDLPDDELLRQALKGLSILEGYRNLNELRDEVNQKACLVGLKPCRATESGFRYDELARQLKIRGKNTLTRATLMQVCQEEGLLTEVTRLPDPFRLIALRSFLGLSTDIVAAAPQDTLLLTDNFRDRYLYADRDWQGDIRPRIEAFLLEKASEWRKLRLVLDTHASIAYLAGVTLDLKSGVEIELLQKGRVGIRNWRVDDGTVGEALVVTKDCVGKGQDLAIALSVTQGVEHPASNYVAQRLPEVGQIIAFCPQTGQGNKLLWAASMLLGWPIKFPIQYGG